MKSRDEQKAASGDKKEMTSFLDHLSEPGVEGNDLYKCPRLGFEDEVRCILQKRIINRVLGNKTLYDLTFCDHGDTFGKSCHLVALRCLWKRSVLRTSFRYSQSGCY